MVFQSNSPQESVSKTAANLYAALAASALEDEEDLVSFQSKVFVTKKLVSNIKMYEKAQS